VTFIEPGLGQHRIDDGHVCWKTVMRRACQGQLDRAEVGAQLLGDECLEGFSRRPEKKGKIDVSRMGNQFQCRIDSCERSFVGGLNQTGSDLNCEQRN
jgi:hypothetical protein